MSKLAASLWNQLPRPFVGLSPMDGVTDVVFRQVVQEEGGPDLLYTEFVNVEGLSRGAVGMLGHLKYREGERPVIAQLYGTEPAAFRTAAQIVAALGFDGLDINMGCPAKKVAHRGAGAGLIRTPERAAEIVAACQAGVQDWAEGMLLSDISTTTKMHRGIQAARTAQGLSRGADWTRRLMPISAKTRLGYDHSVVEEWAAFLAEQPLAAIAVHGRTLKQMYTGAADWEELGKAFRSIRRQNPRIVVMGNGDVASRREAVQKCRDYGCDGVLIGRAGIGNPWVFRDHEPTIQERTELATRHAYLFEREFGPTAFSAYRRHLAAYIKGLPGAAALRNQLMQADSADAVAELLRPAAMQLDE